MAKQRLTKWLKTGYQQFKEDSVLPPWLLPQRSFATVVDGLGDAKILEGTHCLDLSAPAVTELPDIESFPSEMWREACLEWPPLSAIKPVTISLFEASGRIMSQTRRGKIDAEPVVVCRGLLVLAFAPFVPQGQAVLKEIATVLDGDTTSPADLITRFADAVLSGDHEIIARVDDCISRQPTWQHWTRKMQDQALAFTGDYRLVAATPPLSDGLAYALAAMMKEAPHAGA